MKLLLLSILSLTLLLSASAQINGKWTRDWQNYFDSADLCTPRNFTIAVDSSNTPVNITYYYEDYAAIYCTNIYYNQTFSNLTAVATNVIYNDSFGQQIVYNPTQNIIQFTKANSSQPFLYSVNGSYVPVEDAYYPLFGSWNSPQKTNTSDQTVCCVPDGVYVTQLIDATNPVEGRIQLTTNYTSTNCSNTTTQVLEVWYSNISSVNFGDKRENSTIDLTFVPNGVNSQMSIIFNYTNKTCGYTYQKINTTPLIQGTWLLDWQSKDLSSPSPYSIQQYNNTYMYSNYTGRLKDTVKSYVSIDLQGQYYDSGIEEGFTYNSTVNALINTADKLLYSQNGSLFSSANFPNNWANPVSSADSSSCCIPYYVEITANPDLPNQLNAIYFYPDKYDATEGCQDYITDIYGGELVTTLSIKTPSLTELIWEDIIGNKVYWANPSDQTQLQMTVFGQCNLTLTVTTTPPPNPLAASWISSRVVGFIMGLFVIVNYI